MQELFKKLSAHKYACGIAGLCAVLLIIGAVCFCVFKSHDGGITQRAKNADTAISTEIQTDTDRSAQATSNTKQETTPPATSQADVTQEALSEAAVDSEQQSEEITNADSSGDDHSQREPITDAANPGSDHGSYIDKNFLHNMTGNMTDDEREVLFSILNGIENRDTNINIKDKVLKRTDSSALNDIFLLVKSALTDADVIEPVYSFTGGEYVTSIRISYKLSEEEARLQRDETNRATTEILSNIPLGDDYEKALYIHDEILKRCSYSTADRKTANSAYGCLVKGKAGCEGYSKAFMLLCEKAGLECITVTGKATSNGQSVYHMWNKVKISGAWYNADVCWDDPQTENVLKYDYFLTADSDLSTTHFCETNRYYSYPKAFSTSENYFVKNGTLAASEAEITKKIEQAFVNAIKNDSSCASVKFADKGIFDNACVIIADNKDLIFDIIKTASKELGAEVSPSSVLKLANTDMHTLTFVF